MGVKLSILTPCFLNSFRMSCWTWYSSVLGLFFIYLKTDDIIRSSFLAALRWLAISFLSQPMALVYPATIHRQNLDYSSLKNSFAKIIFLKRTTWWRV